MYVSTYIYIIYIYNIHNCIYVYVGALSNIPTSSPFWKLHLSKPPQWHNASSWWHHQWPEAEAPGGGTDRNCQKWSPLIGVQLWSLPFCKKYFWNDGNSNHLDININICHHLVRGPQQKSSPNKEDLPLHHQDGIGWYRLWTTRCLRRCCAKSCTLGW